jgi:hypothetical protein
MFKKLATFAVAAVMSLSASSAFAAFANMDLIRVITDTTAGSTKEIVTNLGAISTLIGTTDNVVGGGASAFTSFIGTSPLANLSVSYFAVNRTTVTSGTLWLASNNTTAPTSASSNGIYNKLATTGGAGNNPTLVYYNTLTATGSTVVADNTNAASIAGKNGTPTNVGLYMNFANAFAANSNVSLSSLASAPIAMTLWQFGPATGMLSTGSAVGVQTLTLLTNADGSTTVNATPIPAAAWLLGSGLMGLVGLRRRKNA